MSTQVTNYQCPACSGPLHFNAASGRLECEYCGSAFEADKIKALYAEKEAKAAQEANEVETSEWDTSELRENWDGDAEGMKSYSCPSCGAELLCDVTTAATSCPYCGNPSIVPGQFAGKFKPDYILPFKLGREDAIAALKKYYGRKPLLPKEFSKKNHISEIKGVYVPFWMFDGETEGSMRFEAIRSHSHRSGGFEVRVTEHFDVRRSGTLNFKKVPVDASGKMPDDYMEAIEPYDTSEFKPFSTAYLPGFLADQFDVSAEDSFERAEKRCRESFKAALAGTVIGYGSCTEKESEIRLKRGKVYYALLPVWVLSTKWKGKTFFFAMNGQNGKLVGELPVSVKRAVALYLAVAGSLIAVGMAVTLLLIG